jgi:subtilisin family serine protease
MIRAACYRSLFAAAILLAGFVSSVGAQSADPTSRFVASPDSGEFVPAIPLGSQRVNTVVLKLAGDPVAVARSRAPSKEISEADRQVIERALLTQQDAIVPAIEAQGGRVLGKFQDAINGIKVQGTPAQIAAMAKLPGVVAVKPVRTYHLDNAASVPFIGAPTVWQGPPGLHGEHIKVAIIDTGIDYTHANFGGPGTVAAFKAAFAASTQPADPTVFGPNAPKVKGGTDLVGDAYNADDPTSVPKRDPNPLDCNGHGSHTSGTAAGFGVTAAGATYHGPYDAITPGQSFTIGPGVAPLADLYAVRVFGCNGTASTNVVVDAIDWAVQHNMQVISMSLGADFGNEDDADAEASENAVNAGVVVVAASGNAADAAYITSSPASGEKAISVAAIDSHGSILGANLALSTGTTLAAQNSNGASFSDGTSLNVVVLRNPAGGISLGCNPAEYTAAGVVGKLVVTRRGTCARVDRAIFGQQAGAAAVLLVNNAPGFPPFEGPITSNPDTGAPFDVTIPFLGVPSNAAAAVLAAASGTAKLTNATFANPSFRQFASFSSAGPRTGDGHLKPDISGPGVSVLSTAMGTGNKGAVFSGTSMATPHVAGSAALAIQAHPKWNADEVSTAIVNTADASKVAGYSPQRGGNGLVQPFPATRTSVIARTEGGAPSLSFGVAEFSRDFEDEGEIQVQNLGTGPANFSVSVVKGPGSPHTITVEPTVVYLSGGEKTELEVTLKVPASTTGDSNDFRQVQGQIKLSPTSGNGETALSVPYFMVPRARSLVVAKTKGSEPDGSSSTVRLMNKSTSVAGTADFYAWGLKGDHENLGSRGLRAVGAQSFVGGSNALVVFAVNTFAPWSNAATNEYDILLDVNGDGKPDFLVFAADLGLVTTGSFNGQMAAGVFNLTTGRVVIRFLADAPTNGDTLLIPFLARDVGVTPANPRFSYVALSFDNVSGLAGDAITAVASFNAFNNSISTGAFVDLAPGSNANVPISIDRAEFAKTPALGEMVVLLENFAKEGKQAKLLPVSGEDGEE